MKIFGSPFRGFDGLPEWGRVNWRTGKLSGALPRRQGKEKDHG